MSRACVVATFYTIGAGSETIRRVKRPLHASIALALGLLAAVPAARLESTEASPYGVNAHAPEGEDLVRLLDAAQAAGIGWIRIDFLWPWVEPRPGVRDYRVYDEIVGEARLRGLEVYANLSATPAWATDGPPVTGVPREVARWRSFVSDSARRYRGRVKAWGIWNEPNLVSFWAGTRAQYVDVLLKPASEEIRAADPDALVCGPDLAHLKAGGADWYTWLLDVLRRAGDAIDVVTHHVYDQGDHGNVTRKLDASTAFGGDPQYWDVVAPSVREVLREAKAEGKPFWLTETGWASDQVGETSQAANVRGLLDDWFGRPGEPSWVKKIFLYELVDDGSDGVGRWGLLRPDRTPKPAYTAVSGFTFSYPPYGDAARVLSAEVPERVAPAVPVPVRVTVRNSGRSTWTREAGHALAPLADAAVLSPGRVALPSGRPVAPGETATFAFSLTAPREGAFLAEWRLVTEEGSRFGPVVSRTVTAAGACPAPPMPVVTTAPVGAVPAGSVAAFAWSPGARAEPMAARYRVQVGTAPALDPARLLVDTEVPGNAFAWRVPAGAGPGLGFRVAALDGCGTAGAFSAVAPFSVGTPPAAIVVTRGQGAPWLVRTGEPAPTAVLAFRNVGGETATVDFDVTGSDFAVSPLSETLGPGEERPVFLSARPAATSAPGVRAAAPRRDLARRLRLDAGRAGRRLRRGRKRARRRLARRGLLSRPGERGDRVGRGRRHEPGSGARPPRPDDRAGRGVALRLERGPRVADPSRRDAPAAPRGRPEAPDARGRRRPGAHRRLARRRGGRRGRPGRRPRRRRRAGAEGRGAGTPRPGRDVVLGRSDGGPDARGSRAVLHLLARPRQPRERPGSRRGLLHAGGLGRHARGAPGERDGPAGRDAPPRRRAPRPLRRDERRRAPRGPKPRRARGSQRRDGAVPGRGEVLGRDPRRGRGRGDGRRGGGRSSSRA